jgi:hypothetical protein
MVRYGKNSSPWVHDIVLVNNHQRQPSCSVVLTPPYPLLTKGHEAISVNLIFEYMVTGSRQFIKGRLQLREEEIEGYSETPNSGP